MREAYYLSNLSHGRPFILSGPCMKVFWFELCTQRKSSSTTTGTVNRMLSLEQCFSTCLILRTLGNVFRDFWGASTGSSGTGWVIWWNVCIVCRLKGSFLAFTNNASPYLLDPIEYVENDQLVKKVDWNCNLLEYLF